MNQVFKMSTAVSTLAMLAVLIKSRVVSAVAECTVNGEVVDCAELGGGLVGWGIGAILLFVIFCIWATVFWIMMLVHLARHDVPHKVMWVILMIFTGLLGSLIYYFVVKRKFKKQQASTPPVTPAQ